jgi:hypothetical protein
LLKKELAFQRRLSGVVFKPLYAACIGISLRLAPEDNYGGDITMAKNKYTNCINIKQITT